MTVLENGAINQSSGSGPVSGPSSSTLNAFPRWGDTTGDTIKNSSVVCDDSNNVSGIADLTVSGAINEADYVTVDSDSTCDIGAAASNNVAISGTTTITSFGTADAGITRRCRATGAFQITYNATSLITANGKNITTKADDCFTMTSLGSGNWIMTSFKPADGRIMANAINNQTGTTYTLALTDIGNDVTLSNASAITTTLPAANTFPIGAKVRVINLGVGLNTFVKTGSDTLLGNTTLAQYGAAELEVLSSSSWIVSYSTATVPFTYDRSWTGTLTNSYAYNITSSAAFPGTLIDLVLTFRTTTVAGTCTVAINGVAVTGLSAIVPGASGVRTSYTPTAANTFSTGDYITITFTGSTVVDLDLTLKYTRVF